MKWAPSDVIRLVAIVGAFVLCAIGAWLMWLGVGATGVVDIKSSIFSGTVQTGSAGLFLIFFGALIVLFVLATLTARSAAVSVSVPVRHSKARAIGRVFAALLVAFIASGSLAALGFGQGFGVLALCLGLAMLFTGVVYTEFAERE